MPIIPLPTAGTQPHPATGQHPKTAAPHGPQHASARPRLAHPQGPCSQPTEPQECKRLQAFADASNALAMAAHYLRHPAANLPAARRKTVQALGALRTLQAMEGGAA
ncbi:hypothetical protein [Comamonas badia]|uniref:hypothetical protein n=1 Tax=Comamonas badia TaxID=265291 RepID=UPI00041F12F5|nr:hypothetical protein [Comamonas badia]